MFAKKVLPFLFVFSLQSAIAQQTDTIRSGNYYGYGHAVNGKKSGPWKYFYADSKYPFAEGSYYSGMKTGEWKFYFNYSQKQKTLKYSVRYSLDIPDGPASFFYVDGRPLAKGQYMKGYVDGRWEYYNGNEKEISTVHYFAMGKTIGTWICGSGGSRMHWTGEMKANGPNGRWIQMQNGTQTGTGLYVDGKREGYWMEFTGNFVYEEGNYHNGEKEGYWIIADIDEGKLESRVYHQGVQDGPDSLFTQGRLTGISHYKNGFPDGACESYDENGNLIAKGNYETNPVFTEHVKCNMRKNRIYVSDIFIIDFIEAGLIGKSVFYFTQEIETTILHRDTMIRHIRNQTLKTDSCDDRTYGIWESRKSGNWQYFYPNGKIKAEGTYALVPKDSVAWDSTNQVEDPNNPGTYIMAPLKFEATIFPYDGWWKIYNQKGILIKEERYEYGVLKETIRK